MSDFDQARTFRDTIDSLHVILGEDDVIVLLKEAVRQVEASKGYVPSAENDVQPVGRPSLVAVAQLFLQLPPRERLNVLEAIISRHGQRYHPLSMMWTQVAASRHLADFARDVVCVRCSYDLALVPALLIAMEAQEVGSYLELRFVSASATTIEVASMLATVLGLTIECVRGNPAAREDAVEFDLEIIMPPFGATITPMEELPMTTQNRLGRAGASGRVSEEAIAVAYVLANVTGRAIISATPASLFRTVGIEPGLREELLSSGRLRAVLSVPGGSAFMTSQIKSAFLVVDYAGSRQDTVRFVDLADPAFSRSTSRRRLEFRPDVDWVLATKPDALSETPWAVDVPLSRIRDENGILSVERYLSSGAGETLRSFAQAHDGVELADVVDLIRPMPILGKGETGDYVVREALPKDISKRGYLAQPEKRIALEPGIYRKVLQQAVKPGDVLLSVKGTIGVVGLVPESLSNDALDEVWVAGQSFMILRPKRRLGLSPVALYEYLTNEIVQEHLRSLAGGAAIQTLNMKDIKTFPVPIPDKATIDQVEAEHARRQALHDKIDELTASLAQDRAQSWPHDELKGDS